MLIRGQQVYYSRNLSTTRLMWGLLRLSFLDFISNEFFHFVNSSICFFPRQFKYKMRSFPMRPKDRYIIISAGGAGKMIRVEISRVQLDQQQFATFYIFKDSDKAVKNISLDGNDEGPGC